MYVAIKGVYNEGQIEFLEPAPDMKKAKVIVLFESEDETLSKAEPNVSENFSFRNLRAFGMWENNDDIKDDLEFAKQLREQWDRTF